MLISSLFISEFCHGRSFYQRSLFIDICKQVLELYSRSFFKDYFFESLLELCIDSVPNVRLRICPLLPKLKGLIKLPSDRIRLQLIESYVRKMLVNEEDIDVKSRLDQVTRAQPTRPTHHFVLCSVSQLFSLCEQFATE